MFCSAQRFPGKFVLHARRGYVVGMLFSSLLRSRGRVAVVTLASAAALAISGCGGGSTSSSKSPSTAAPAATATPSGPRIYVSDETGTEVVVIDPAAGQVVQKIAVGKRPRGIKLSPDGASLYVA